MIYIFKTSVKNKIQIKGLKHELNSIALIARWNFDLEDCDKILRIDSTENISTTIIGLLKSHNFDCEELF